MYSMTSGPGQNWVEVEDVYNIGGSKVGQQGKAATHTQRAARCNWRDAAVLKRDEGNGEIGGQPAFVPVQEELGGRKPCNN